MVNEDPTYADRLRESLDRDGWSQARLVKELAGRTGNAPESERSAVRGYLQGSMPRPERAALIAEITGVKELAVVDHPRQSAMSRLERRLEELAKNDAELLENQAASFGVLEEIRDVLGLRRAAGSNAPKQTRRRRER